MKERMKDDYKSQKTSKPTPVTRNRTAAKLAAIH
jgi:hypothetical protein